MKRLLAAFALLVLNGVANATNPVVELHTNRGVITLELDAKAAPQTVENFVAYVKSGFYAGTVFHRVIDGFMIQGGGFDQGLRQKPTRAAIRNEATNGLRNTTGTIAMARTDDPNSATAQFFINLVDNTNLDARPGSAGYAVFGSVVGGMDVVRAIGKTPVRPMGPHRHLPAEPVILKRAVLKAPAN